MKTRTDKTIKNSIWAGIHIILQMLVSFIAQKIFINILNVEYLGINGLFSNIISFLGIAELGLGEAIIFHLYKPIAANDKKKIKSYLKLYKKAYNTIAIIVLIVGTAIIPILPYFIGEVNIDENINIIYFLFLLQTVFSYLISYKRSIIYAYQDNYIISIIDVFYTVLMHTLQILSLVITKNYYIYLITKMVCIIIENYIISKVADAKYPFIKEKNVAKLTKKENRDIIERLKAQFFHKIGGVVVGASDNLIISKFINVSTVGIYSNYNMVISAIQNLFVKFISAIIPSVGNLLVEKDYKKNYEVYKRVRFLNFWIATFASIGILVVIQDFIKLWLGEEYLLEITVVIALCINNYQKIMRAYNDSFLSAAGICIETKFVPLIESTINIIVSIILLKIMGLQGVFWGTIISGLALWCYSYPKYAYKKLLNRSYTQYYRETIGYLVLFLALGFITYWMSTLIKIKNTLLSFIINLLLVITIPNIVIIIIFHKTDNYQYYVHLIKNKIKELRYKNVKKREKKKI